MVSKNKFIYKICWLMAVNLILVSCTFAPDTFELKFQVDGLKKGDTINIGFYHEESKIVIDSPVVNSTLGDFVFSSKDTPLASGMYFVSHQNQKIFDFLVDKDQFFTLHTTLFNPINDMQVIDDIGNFDFYEDLKKSEQLIQELQPMINDRRSPDVKEIVKDSLDITIDEIKEAYRNYLDNRHLKLHPNSSFLKYVNSERNPLQNIDTFEDPKDKLNYGRQHFWDYYDLSDPFFIRLPNDSYRKKIKTYLGRLCYPQADSLIVGVEKVIEQAKSNSETYSYTVKFLLDEFTYTSVDRDSVFIHLYNRYISSGEMDYQIDTRSMEMMEKRSEIIQRSLVGKQATDLKMKDYQGIEFSLYDIQSNYTLLLVFDITCDLCVKKIPELKRLSKVYKDVFKIVAIDINNSSEELEVFAKEKGIDWKMVSAIDQDNVQLHKYYNTQATPSMYLFDEAKRIVERGSNIIPIVNDKLNYKI